MLVGGAHDGGEGSDPAGAGASVWTLMKVTAPSEKTPAALFNEPLLL